MAFRAKAVAAAVVVVAALVPVPPAAAVEDPPPLASPAPEPPEAAPPPAPGAPGVAVLLTRLQGLYQDAEQATETYDAAEEELTALAARTRRLTRELAGARDAAARARAEAGRFARAQYRGRAPQLPLPLRLLFARDARAALDGERTLRRAAAVEAAAVARTAGRSGGRTPWRARPARTSTGSRRCWRGSARPATRPGSGCWRPRGSWRRCRPANWPPSRSWRRPAPTRPSARRLRGRVRRRARPGTRARARRRVRARLRERSPRGRPRLRKPGPRASPEPAAARPDPGTRPVGTAPSAETAPSHLPEPAGAGPSSGTGPPVAFRRPAARRGPGNGGVPHRTGRSRPPGAGIVRRRPPPTPGRRPWRPGRRSSARSPTGR